MANELQSLTDLFPKKVFRIPDYQRGYAWEKDHLDDFWEDIMNLWGNQKIHYAGLISLAEIPDDEKSEEYRWLINQKYSARHIVDGQQRLTTISILINEIVLLLEQLEKKGEEAIVIEMTASAIRNEYICKTNHNGTITTYLFGYDVDEPSDEYLRFKVYGEKNPPQILDTAYTRNLLFAKKYFEKAISLLYHEKGLKGIEDLFIAVTQRFMFNVHEISKDYDVFVAFETMNNRGKPLSHLELLKNRLIYLITLFDELDSDAKTIHRKKIDKAWKEIYKQLGKNPDMKPLSDDEYLRNYWILNYPFDAKSGNSYADYLLKTKFTTKNVLDVKELPAVVDTRDKNENDTDLSQQLYFEDDDTRLSQETTDEMKEIRTLGCDEIMTAVGNLQTMAKYWYYTFYPNDSSSCFTENERMWIERLNRLGMLNFRHVIVASLKPGISTTQERERLFEQIERFVFVVYRLHTRQSHYRVKATLRNARELFSGAITVERLTYELKAEIDNMLEDVHKNFAYYIGEKFKRGEGYYSWDYLRYFLFEYESKKAEGTAAAKKLNWSDFQKHGNDKISIEHIFPQSATAEKWGEIMNELASVDAHTVVNSLGNLLPLSLSINSSLQNESFNEKKSDKRNENGDLLRRGYDTGCYSEIEVSKHSKWTVQSIHKRGLSLLAFAEQRWGVAFGNESQKTKLLGLEFLLAQNEAQNKGNESFEED